MLHFIIHFLRDTFGINRMIYDQFGIYEEVSFWSLFASCYLCAITKENCRNGLLFVIAACPHSQIAWVLFSPLFLLPRSNHFLENL